MVDEQILWEGVIPVVANFNLETVRGSARAYDNGIGNSGIRLEIHMGPEEAEMIRVFLEHQMPLALSWTTRPTGQDAIDKFKKAHAADG